MSFAALLALPAAASAAVQLPDPAANLLTAPTVAVTPTGNGAVIEIGAADTTIQAGAGTGGVTVGTHPRNSSPATPDTGVPVSTPGDRRGRERSPAGGGSGGNLFGPASSGGTSAAGIQGSLGSVNAVRPPSTSEPGSERLSTSEAGAAGSGNHTDLPPFLEFVDHIPPTIMAGLVALALLALAVWAAWVRDRRRLQQNAFVDPVTGIANAPAFEGLLANELERAKRYKRPLSLVLLEVSDLHQSFLPLRDQTLRDVTAAIRGRVRDSDMVGRLGPSRFAVVCPEATVASAETLARGLELRLEGMRLHVAAGTVERQPTDLAAEHILARAEAALATPGQPEPKLGSAVLQAA